MKTFEFIKKTVRPYYKFIIYALIFHILGIVFINTQCYLTKLTINSLIGTHPHSFQSIAPIMGCIIINIILVKFSGIFLDKIFIINLMPRLRQDIKLITIKKLFNHSYNFYSNNLCGSLVNKINDISEGIANILPIVIERFFGTFLMLLISLITVKSANVKYTLIILVWSLTFIAISYKSTNISRALSKSASEKRAKVIGTLTDIVSNIQNVRYFVNQEIEYRNLSQSITLSIKLERERDLYSVKLYILKTILFIILNCICFVCLLLDYSNNMITTGDFSLVLSINFLLNDYFSVLSKNFYRFVETIGNIEQGLSTIFISEDIIDDKNAKDLIITFCNISYKNVSFRYNDSSDIFKDLSIDIRGGSKVGLIGYSGTGKSTFIKLLLRYFDVNNGCIELDKQDIRKVTQKSLHKAIGIVPQDISLFHRSILENIRYGNPTATNNEVFNAAKKANIHDFILTLKNGYNTIVGERGIKLSGGQKQRIAIARCIIKDAPILILDEATSHLDSVSEKLIQNSLHNFMKNRTAIIIAHRISTIINLDKILVFVEGRIVEEGNHEELLGMDGVYTNLWKSQHNGFIYY